MRLTTKCTRRIVLTVCFLTLFAGSCRHASKLERALTLAGDNRAELEKVLTRYSTNAGDSLKYRAAVFLIENMPGYGYYRGEHLEKFLEYYPLLKEVRSRKEPPDKAVDSIKTKYGSFDVAQLDWFEDITTVDSAYLCNNIEWAFKVWKEQPWGKNVSFDDFCEYVLPYRLGTETLTEWREDYYNRYNAILDDFRSPNNPEREDPAAAARSITDSLTGPGKINFTSATPAPGMPSIGPAAAAYRSGSCQNLVDFDLYLCRALGIPAAADYMPFRGDGNVGHTWASFLGKGGRIDCQDMGNRTVDVEKMKKLRKLKVYRRTFSINDSLMSLEVPETEKASFLNTPRFVDVTSKYALDFHRELRIGWADMYGGKRNGTVYLCMSSRFSWIPVAAGSLRHGEAVFRDIDAETQIMRVATIEDGKIHLKSDPFYITTEGELHFYHPADSLQDITVFRKFARVQELWLMRRMLGGVFEGSNSADFSNCDTLHVITELPERLQVRVPSLSKGPYRYVRYFGPKNGFCNIAEMAVYSAEGEQLSGTAIGIPGSYNGDEAHDFMSALDGKPDTSFDSKRSYGAWVGLDFGEKVEIGDIVYTPRNRDNHVRPGDEYELFWCDTTWKSAGVVRASADSILYKKVPSNTVYILNNLTRGNQIRLFTYSNGQQIWLRPGADQVEH